MFKAAALAGVYEAKAKVAGWSDDEISDLAAAALPGTPYPLLTAPGGNFVSGTLRTYGRGALEGLGGAAVGGLSGAALAALITRMGGANPDIAKQLLALGAMSGGSVGASVGALHGGYASRRNQRKETGDYHWAGFNRGKKEEQK